MPDRFDRVRHVVAGLPAVRWMTCGLLWAVLLAVWLFPGLDLPLRSIALSGSAAAICRTAVALVVHYRHFGRPVPHPLRALSLSADAVLLAGLLDITGGPFNPFIVVYAIYIWIAVVTMPAQWAVIVTSTSVIGFGWLVVDHLRAGALEHHRLNDFPTHLFAMWFAGAAIAELVAHYVARAQAALAQRQHQLDEARERARRSEHLAALTTLAAGAAHELSTPLATIAVAARELERNAARFQAPSVDSLREDARLIRTEVDRCQVILDGMSGRAREGGPVGAEPLSPEAILRLARERLTEAQQRRLRVEIESDLASPSVAGIELVQAISSLLRNALEASDSSTEVSLRFVQRGPMARVEVHDHGAGMSPETRRRAGEPFYTTKEPGQGLGLGLFLTRAFAEHAGGSLQFEAGDGTTAILEIPVRAPEVSVA
jgi:two-component system sensor histidine kinase RegB